MLTTFARAFASAPSTSTPSTTAVASEGSGVVDSTKVAPAEPEKVTYA